MSREDARSRGSVRQKIIDYQLKLWSLFFNEVRLKKVIPPRSMESQRK